MPNTSAPGPLKGHAIVFTGFRSDELKQQINRLGGRVTDRQSGKTTMLVYKKTKRNEDKLAAAAIPTMSVESFCQKHNLAKPTASTKPKKETPAASLFLLYDTRRKTTSPLPMPSGPDDAYPMDAQNYKNRRISYKGKDTTPDLIWSQARNITHAIFDKKVTATKRVMESLFYSPKKDVMAVVLFHRSATVKRDWDASLVVFAYDPTAPNKRPFNFGKQGLIPLFSACKKQGMTGITPAQVAAHPAVKKLGLVLMFDKSA